jgi:hypothetical protein
MCTQNFGKFAIRSHGYLVMMGYGKLFGWVFCQVHFMPPMSFKLPAHFVNFWAAKGLNIIFCLLKNLLPELRLPMIPSPPK